MINPCLLFVRLIREHLRRIANFLSLIILQQSVVAAEVRLVTFTGTGETVAPNTITPIKNLIIRSNLKVLPSTFKGMVNFISSCVFGLLLHHSIAPCHSFHIPLGFTEVLSTTLTVNKIIVDVPSWPPPFTLKSVAKSLSSAIFMNRTASVWMPIEELAHTTVCLRKNSLRPSSRQLQIAVG